MKTLAFALAVLLPATGLALTPPGPVAGERAPDAMAAASPTEGRRAAPARRYSGRRIDIDFKNANIHDVLGILGDVGGVLIVTAAGVKARVSIRMRNAPWEEVLDVLTRDNGLAYEREGKVIRVRKGR